MLIGQDIQNEYRLKYNPDGSELRNMQLGMLEILKYVDKVCQDNNITYWLSSGTCLGAVRHGGFIPWDDDVDIEMLKDDYEKLVSILSKNEDSCAFELQNNSNDPFFIYDFSKLRNKNTEINEYLPLAKKYRHKGLFIDIFKLEKSNSAIIHYLCGRLRVLEYHYLRYVMDKNPVLVKSAFLFHKINTGIFSILRPIDSLLSKTQLRHTLGVTFTKPRDLSDILPLQRIRFEDTYLPVPQNYDNYLRKMYGDYHKIVLGPTHISSDTNSIDKNN